jgi:hypothetical protein
MVAAAGEVCGAGFVWVGAKKLFLSGSLLVIAAPGVSGAGRFQELFPVLAWK